MGCIALHTVGLLRRLVDNVNLGELCSIYHTPHHIPYDYKHTFPHLQALRVFKHKTITCTGIK